MAWLWAEPTSIATLRAVAILLRAIRLASLSSSSAGHNKPSPYISANASLPILTLVEPNLGSQSRLLRLSTARLLARYDSLPFVDDGSPGSTFGTWAPGSQHQHLQQHQEGPCGFLDAVEALETLPISLAAERDMMWRLGQLEVMGRSGRLPRPYASLMATHALGLLRVKFSGVWPRATAIIAALSQRPRQRELVWEPVHSALRNVMPPPATRNPSVTSAAPELRSGTPKGGETGSSDGKTAVAILAQERQSCLRKSIPPPQPWVPRLLSHAAALDAGPTEEVDLPVALQGVFLDESVRTGLQPESGEVPLWASTDDDSAFTQVLFLLEMISSFCLKRST